MSDLDPVSPTAPATPNTPADDELFWRETLGAFPATGLSVRAFCAAHGLHEKRFYTWRKTLGLSPVARPTPTPAPRWGFVPVRLVADPAAEVVQPGGVVLRVPASPDPSYVARLVAALRGEPC